MSARRRVGGATERSVAEQVVGIIVDRQHGMLGEQAGQQPHHHFAVFQHVGHAGGRAAIVLQDVEILVVDTHDVDAGDMGPDVVRARGGPAFPAGSIVAENEVLGNDPRAQNVLAAVDVGEEHVQRLDALDQAGFEPAPFVAADAGAG